MGGRRRVVFGRAGEDGYRGGELKERDGLIEAIDIWAWRSIVGEE